MAPPRKVIRSEIVMFRLTPDQAQTVHAVGEEDFLTVSEVIRIALAEYLARRGAADIRAYRGTTRGPWSPQAEEEPA